MHSSSTRLKRCRVGERPLYTEILVVVKIMLPSLDPLNTRCQIIPRTQKGAIVWTNTVPTSGAGCIYVLLMIEIPLLSTGERGVTKSSCLT